MKPHQGVIELLDFMEDGDFWYLVMPYFCGGDMFSRIEEGGKMSEEGASRCLRQICEGLLSMKEGSGLAHHDVSLENLVCDGQGNVRIIDFGMCLHMPPITPPSSSSSSSSSSPSIFNNNNKQQPLLAPPRVCMGKPSFLAPEVVSEVAADPYSSDVWSLGICLYIMLTGHPLYSSSCDKAFKAMTRIGGSNKVIAAYESCYGMCLPEGAKDLVCSMLHANPIKRPTLEEILQHSFITTGGVAIQAPAANSLHPNHPISFHAAIMSNLPRLHFCFRSIG